MPSPAATLPVVFAPVLDRVGMLITGESWAVDWELPLDYAEQLNVQLSLSIMRARMHKPARTVAELLG